MLDRNVDMDNAGLVSFGTLFGWWTAHKIGIVLVAVPVWITHFGVSILTMVVGAVVLHFVKRYLKRRWPDVEKEAPKV